ncbi:MAG TPA: DNA polymerase/3'-5' exonuclease PolX [Armatimonadota bacterium]|nr:DNA polymerase/3'-5' exonuclease PolX [Armatimonadota bacterium]
MTNREIADVLDQIGDMLEIQGENVFKVRSYRRAAETIGRCSFAITGATASEQLRELPGIGESLSQLILEVAATGTCPLREQLLAVIPQGLLDVLRVPGVGPKTAGALFHQLHVTDIRSLEEACRSGAVAALPRMGAKSQERILEGIALLQRSAGRILLSEAAAIAARVIEQLPPPCEPVVAGSFRRGRETVGDIDILAVEVQGLDPMAAFTGMPEVEQVLLHGDTRSSVVVKGGVQVDLRVIPRPSMGAALQYFTGSQQHNIRVRERAGAMGLRLSEYGLFDADDRQIAGASEAEVYGALGLDWIPPELREDAGEVARAAEHALPRLVELHDVRGDLQMHSQWSDGAHTIRQMAEAARARGLDYIAITDHSKALGVANGLDEDRLLRQIEEIRALNQELEGFTVLAGCEVEILADGRLDIADEVLAELDIVLACVHSGLNAPSEAITRRMVRAAEHPHVCIIGHPSGRLIGQRDRTALDLDALIRTCVDTRTALEVNSGPQRLDLCDHDVRRALEMGAHLVISTDAHSAESLSWLTYGVQTARRGWATPDRVLNTRPVAGLRAFFTMDGGNP